MAPPVLDYYCRGLHPNPFDPSRCGACLRPGHMHLNTGTGEEGVWEETPLQDVFNDAEEECDLCEVTTSAGSDDISGAWIHEWSLGHSLSPERELNICDTDAQYSSQTWDCPRWRRSVSAGRSLDDMTRFDPALHRGADSGQMDGRRSRDRSRRPSESTGNRERESRFFSSDRNRKSEQQPEESNKRTYRYFERGRPLPNTYVREAKACVPFRTVNLGLPSQRRNSDTFQQESWRSESPQRYTYHSNFRKGADSQRNSPSRQSSVSPDRHKYNDVSSGHQRGSSLSRGQSRSRVPSQLPSHAPSRHSSRCSSPSRRRPSISHSATPSHKKTNSYHVQNGDYHAQNMSSRGSRTPSQSSSHKHSLDSEKLYKNLESISHRSSPPVQQKSYEGSQSSPRTAVNSAVHTRARNSRDVSPGGNGYGTHSSTPHKESVSRDTRLSPSQESWQGSAHSLLSNPLSRGSSTSVRHADAHTLGPGPVPQVTAAPEVTQAHGDRSRSSGRRGMDALLISEPKKTSEVVEEVGMTLDDYIELADIPKIYLESEEENVGLRQRNESPSPCRNQRTRSERHTDEANLYSSRVESDDRGRIRERGRDRREKSREHENGRSSRRHSVASVHSQSSDKPNGKHRKRERAEQPQTQGWISILDDHGKWRKHWFVLGNRSVRFYRDSEAEESDDPEGEIDLRSCLDVSDCDVDKNYGFQLQTKKAVFTLSAMTSRIRRNWVKLLKLAIQNNTHQSESGREKANPLPQRRSPCQPPAQLSAKESRREPADSHLDLPRDLDLSRREEGEGWDREQAKRLEERNKWFEEGLSYNEMCSRWDSMELKKGSVPIPVIDTMDSEVNRKWTEFERLSFREMTAQSLIGNEVLQSNSQQSPTSPSGSQSFQFSIEEHKDSFAASENIIVPSNSHAPNYSSTLTNGAQNSQNTAEAIQKEAISLRKQVESIKKERATLGIEEIEVDSPCGPGAPCRAKMKAMIVAHQKEIHELREKHDLEIKELEKQRDKMLKEESEAAAKAVDRLKAAHLEEMTRAVKEGQGSKGGSVEQRVSQAYASHSELDELSDGYSQKCLELNQTENSSKSKDADLGRMEKELEHLRRENQELKSRLAEEISRMRCFITGQKSDMDMSTGSERSVSELEMLLKDKENEVLSLRKEISCLENEVQSLHKLF